MAMCHPSKAKAWKKRGAFSESSMGACGYPQATSSSWLMLFTVFGDLLLNSCVDALSKAPRPPKWHDPTLTAIPCLLHLLRSRLASAKLAFAPYNKDNLVAIMHQRLQLAGCRDLFNESSLQFAARKVCDSLRGLFNDSSLRLAARKVHGTCKSEAGDKNIGETEKETSCLCSVCTCMGCGHKEGQHSKCTDTGYQVGQFRTYTPYFSRAGQLPPKKQNWSVSAQGLGHSAKSAAA
eukprot:232936-Pelagomonas_calceolata.AAC.4